MIKTLIRAGEILEVRTDLVTDEDSDFKVKSANSDKWYAVSCRNMLWRCDCKDFEVHGLHKNDGSYLCKHIYAVIESLLGINSADAFELVGLDEYSDELIQTQIVRQLLEIENHLQFINNCHVESDNYTSLVKLKDYLLKHQEALKNKLNGSNKPVSVP
ncbi:MAG: SWIM zinc finger family protein [Methanobacteriaceae archaeon]